MTANPVTMLDIFRRAYPVVVSLYHTVKHQETEKTRARIESLERNEGDVQTLHRAWTNMERALWRSPRTYQPSFYLVDAMATPLHRVTPLHSIECPDNDLSSLLDYAVAFWTWTWCDRVMVDVGSFAGFI